jgi:hypothetical protein
MCFTALAPLYGHALLTGIDKMTSASFDNIGNEGPKYAEDTILLVFWCVHLSFSLDDT